MVFLVLFLVWPVAEITLFIEAGLRIGFFNTLVLFGISALLGSLLMQWQGFKTTGSIRDTLSAGTVPGPEIFDTICIFMAGMLLILPGFISDAAAIALLIPACRRGLRLWLGVRFSGKTTKHENIIEGEFTRVNDPDTYHPTLESHNPDNREKDHD